MIKVDQTLQYDKLMEVLRTTTICVTGLFLERLFPGMKEKMGGISSFLSKTEYLLVYDLDNE